MDRREEVRVAALHEAVRLARVRAEGNASAVFSFNPYTADILADAEKFERFIRGRPEITNTEDGGA